MTDDIRILVVDDQALMGQALASFFDAEPGFSSAGAAASVDEALRMIGQDRPDVVMMDLQMPLVDGVEGTRRVLELPDPPKVIALTTFSTTDLVVSALRAGASGYLVKDTAPDTILDSVRQVMDNVLALSPRVAQVLAEEVVSGSGSAPQRAADPQAAAREAGLTERELQVVTLLSGGLNNREMAERLHLSEGSIKMNLSRACDRLGARDRVQLLIRAVELGLVQPALQDPSTALDRRYL